MLMTSTNLSEQLESLLVESEFSTNLRNAAPQLIAVVRAAAEMATHHTAECCDPYGPCCDCTVRVLRQALTALSAAMQEGGK